MGESRQQRRARERAAAKAATRPGPNPPPATNPASEGPRVLEVALDRFAVDDDPYDVSWAAEWALSDDSSSTEDSDDDLQELVNGILDDVQDLVETYGELRIEWNLGGDPPPDGTVADAIAAAGVTLPRTLRLTD